MLEWTKQKCKFGGNINSYFLALIPKELNPLSFAILRPTSLYNASYKILTNIIANCLKKFIPKHISKNQGFITKRQILDNVILVQESIHRSYLSKIIGMVIKLDLANAFDRVRYSFLFQVMETFGFEVPFISWIKAYIISPLDCTTSQWQTNKYFSRHQRYKARIPFIPSSVYSND